MGALVVECFVDCVKLSHYRVFLALAFDPPRLLFSLSHSGQYRARA